MAGFNAFNSDRYRFRPRIRVRWMSKPWPRVFSTFRGANFLQVYFWRFDVSVGMPYLKSTIWHDGWDASWRNSNGIFDKTPDLP